jgi:hypothetical protein
MDQSSRADWGMARRKVFVSYHRADTAEVQHFVRAFDTVDDVFIHRAVAVMSDDIINSADSDYIMRRIRESYLEDSTVTLVLVGRCTWARKFCDWELQASLRSGLQTTPNGLLGVVLTSAGMSPTIPERLSLNMPDGTTGRNGYARCYRYPRSAQELEGWIEDAFAARTARTHLIRNPRERFSYNRQCS